MSGIFGGQYEAYTISHRTSRRCMRGIGPRSWLRLRALGCVTEGQYSLFSQKCSSAQRSVHATARSWSSSGDVLCTLSTGSLQAHLSGPSSRSHSGTYCSRSCAGGSEAAGAPPADQRRERVLPSQANYRGHLGQPGSFALGGLPVASRTDDGGTGLGPSPDGGALQHNGRHRPAADAGGGLTIRDLLQSFSITLREYTAGQHRTTCPHCQGGSTQEKSLAVGISADGQEIKCLCHRASCGWAMTRRLGDHTDTQLRAGADPVHQRAYSVLQLLARRFTTACGDRLGARQGARQAAGAASQTAAQAGAAVRRDDGFLCQPRHQHQGRGAQRHTAGKALVTQA